MKYEVGRVRWRCVESAMVTDSASHVSECVKANECTSYGSIIPLQGAAEVAKKDGSVTEILTCKVSSFFVP